MTAILTYHHLGSPAPDAFKNNLHVTPESFEAQLQRLREKKIEIITLGRLRDGLLGQADLPKRSAVITFDDGFADNYEFAFPLLQQYGATAVFFAISGRIGETGESGEAHMSAAQLREMAAAGMEIGSHTASHPWLARIPIEQAREEISDSKTQLEALLDTKVEWLCYPRGSFNREVAATAEQAGYLGACSVIRDNRQTRGQLYWLPRVMVMPDTTLAKFDYFFSSLYHWVHWRKNRRRWKDYL